MPEDEKFDAASVAIFRDGEVLLIKRAQQPYRGFWTLPGGRIEAGERAEACARREILEELGLVLSPRFVGRHEVALFDRQFALAVFAAKFTKGKFTPNAEIAEWRWLLPHNFEDLKMTPDLVHIVASASQAITRG